MKILDSTKSIAAQMSYRYFVINEAGEFSNRNEYGYAIGFCFVSKAAGSIVAARRRHSLWDSVEGRFVDLS